MRAGLKSRHSNNRKVDVSPFVTYLGLRPNRLFLCPTHNDVNIIKDMCMLVDQKARNYTPSVRSLDLESRPELTPYAVHTGSRSTLIYPHPPWTATKEGKEAMKALFDDVSFMLPKDRGSTLASPFTHLAGMKFADVLLLASKYGTFLFESLGLHTSFRDTVCEILLLMNS